MPSEDPFPGQGGDKELLYLEFKLYRLYVGRSLTVFCQVCEKGGLVKILEIATMDKGAQAPQAFRSVMYEHKNCRTSPDIMPAMVQQPKAVQISQPKRSAG
jgi:hypothetical protein